MKEPILVMMAAGMGSRYGGLKQLDPVGPDGEVILDYSLYDAYQAGFRRVGGGGTASPDTRKKQVLGSL